MNLLFLDFESYYSTADKYTLNQKQGGVSAVEYVRDPRFKVHGVGIQAKDARHAMWVSEKEIRDIFKTLDWPNIIVVCHNTKFDGLILREIYGIQPHSYICTKAMSKAVLGKSVKSHSLADIALHFGLEPKGVMKTDGIRDLSDIQEKELSEYCLHDVELCREIYSRLAKEFPQSQYEIMNWTIDSFVNPKLQLNVKLLEETNEKEKEHRKNIFKEIGIDKAEFASNKKFPDLLLRKGYEVPTKTSPRTGKIIPALALGDTGFLELMENGNEELKALCEARITAKSTLLETRSAKLAAIGRTGQWPFDVEFSGADQTHRFSGGSGAGGNPQNFTRESTLREAVEAPEGYSLVVGDFANIELRLQAYLSKDPGLIKDIEDGTDIYCDFASKYYGRKITRDDKKERVFGKTAILGLGYGMGPKKFQTTVKIKTGDSISMEEAEKTVELYRTLYSRIPATWGRLHDLIPRMTVDHVGLITGMPLTTGKEFIVLPSGLKIKFMNLRQEGREWIYDVYNKKNLEQRKIYGGKLFENICQALAGELCKEAALPFGSDCTGLMHDEIHVICKKGLELVTKQKLQKMMITSPLWFPQIKLEAEITHGKSWGEAH